MKNKLAIIITLLFSMSLLLSACGGSKNITITNNGTAGDYCEIYVAPAGTEEFGDNQLPDGQTVTSGAEFKIPVTESGSYDVRVVVCDGAGEQTVTVDVP